MSLDPDCLARLGLRQPPFGAVTSSEFVYCDALLDGFVDLANRALAEPNAIVALTGPSGSGRSILLMRLLGLLPENIELMAFRARPDTDFELIEQTIRHHLGTLGSERLERPLRDLFGERIRAGAVQVLAIDDVQTIATNEMQELLRLRRSLIDTLGVAPRLVLVGDSLFAHAGLPGLDDRDDDRFVRLQLRPFNREQLLGYLRLRLAAAGAADPDALLRRADLDDLIRQSRGMPKLLDAAATAWLETLCHQAPEPAATGPNEASAFLSAMSAMRANLLTPDAAETLGHGPASGGKAGGTKAGGGKEQRAQATRIAGQAPAGPIWQRSWFVPALALGAVAAIFVPLFWQLPDTTRELPGSPTGSANAGPPERGREREVAPLPLPGPPLAEPGGAAEPDAEAEADFASLLRTLPETAANQDGPDGLVRLDGRIILADPPPIDPRARRSPEPVSEPESEPEPTPRPAPTPAQEERPQSPTDAESQRWLATQNPNHWTVQLTASGNLAAARDYVGRFNLNDVRFIPIRAQGRDYVVALLGSFPDNAAAQRAVATLPDALRTQGYWIRTIGSVQNSAR